MKTITRKSLLYKTGVEYGDFTINHVLGCSHGCMFPCYAFNMAKRFGNVKTYEEWIEPKLVSNALELLEIEIPKYKKDIKSVQLSFTTDPFMEQYPEVGAMTLKIINRLNKDNIKTSKRRNNKRKKDSDNEGMSTAASDAAGREDRSKYDGYSNYLFFHGFSSVIYCSEGAWGFCYDDPGQQADFRRQLAENKDIASAMHERYVSAGFSEEANAIVDAMTTGNKTEISKQLRQQFSDAGISHVLALSGFHLTVIVSLIDVLLLRGVFSRRWRRMSALLVIPFIWAFAYIAGFPPSLVRATIMCSVFQLALVVGHGQQLKNAAAIAGFFMIAFSPMIIMDVGFQLSFLSIVGIAVMGAPLCTWLGQKTGRWAYVLDILCISLTCTLFTFPVVAYHFGQVPLYSLLSNLFVSLIATLIMWAAVFWWIFSWCNPVCGLLTSVLNGLTRAMVFVAESVSQLPMATVKYSPNILEVICLYLVIGYVLVYSYNKKRKYLGISALMMLLVPVVHYML